MPAQGPSPPAVDQDRNRTSLPADAYDSFASTSRLPFDAYFSQNLKKKNREVPDEKASNFLLLIKNSLTSLQKSLTSGSYRADEHPRCTWLFRLWNRISAGCGVPDHVFSAHQFVGQGVTKISKSMPAPFHVGQKGS